MMTEINFGCIFKSFYWASSGM